MGRKLFATAAGLTVCLGIYAFNSLKTGSTADKILEAQAHAYVKEEKYEKALEYLLKIRRETPEIQFLMAKCYEKTGQAVDALVYITMAIEASLQKEYLDMRLRIYRYLGMEENSFKDLFLITMLSDEKEYKKEATTKLQKMAMKLARENPIVGPASKVSYKEFFESLMFIKSVEAPSTVFITSGEYQRCYDLVKESENEHDTFLNSCFKLLHGDYKGAYGGLEGQEYVYSRMMRLYLRVWMVSKGIAKSDSSSNGAKRCKLRFADLDEAAARDLDPEEFDALMGNLDEGEGADLVFLMKNADQTIYFYLSKIFEIGNSALGAQEKKTLAKGHEGVLTKNQEGMLSRAMAFEASPSVQKYKIILLIRQENISEASRLLSEGLRQFPGNVGFYSIAIEYHLHLKNIKKARELLGQLEQMGMDDVRVCILRYLVSKADGHPNAEHLKAGIKMDPLYYKTYIYLGNQMMGTSDSLHSYKMALSCARTIEEAYSAYQLILVIEAQMELSKEYPDLFAGSS